MKKLLFIILFSSVSFSQVSKTYYRLSLPNDTAIFYRTNTTKIKSTIDTSDTRYTTYEYFSQGGIMQGYDVNAQNTLTDKGYDVWDRYDLPIAYDRRFDQYGIPDSVHLNAILTAIKLKVPLAAIDSFVNNVKIGNRLIVYNDIQSNVGLYAYCPASLGTYIGIFKGKTALPGDTSQCYPVLKTDYNYLYFAAIDKQVGYWGNDGSTTRLGLINNSGTEAIRLSTDGPSFIGGSLKVAACTTTTLNTGNITSTDTVSIGNGTKGVLKALSYVLGISTKSFKFRFEGVDWIDASIYTGNRLWAYMKGQLNLIDGGLYVNRYDTLASYKFAVKGNALIDSNLVFGTTYSGMPIRTIYMQDSARDLVENDTMWIYDTYPNTDHNFVFPENYFNGKKRWVFKFNINVSNTQVYLKYYSVNTSSWIDQAMELNPTGEIEYKLHRHSSTEISLTNGPNQQYWFPFPGTAISDQLQLKIYAIASSGGGGDVKYATVEIQEVQ